MGENGLPIYFGKIAHKLFVNAVQSVLGKNVLQTHWVCVF